MIYEAAVTAKTDLFYSYAAQMSLTKTRCCCNPSPRVMRYILGEAGDTGEA